MFDYLFFCFYNFHKASGDGQNTFFSQVQKALGLCLLQFFLCLQRKKIRRKHMKDNIVWGKTLLSVYRYLERIAGAIDKIIMQSALGSANIVGQNYYYNNVYSITQKILDLSERKVTIINLKLLIEEALSAMDKQDALILIEKYIDGIKSKDIMQKHDISMRTVFRKLDGAVKGFVSALQKKGFSGVRLEKMLENEGWINNAYKRIAEKNEDDFTLSSAYLSKAVSM